MVISVGPESGISRWDVSKDTLLEASRESIQHLLFQNPNEPYKRSEVVSQPMPHKVTYDIGNTRELHRLQAHGLFQLWSRIVDIAGIDQANLMVFGRSAEVDIFVKDGENCEGK